VKAGQLGGCLAGSDEGAGRLDAPCWVFFLGAM
jgi:hypothetical protein